QDRAVMRIIASTDRARLNPLLTRNASRDPAIERAAARIVNEVRTGGDAALAKWMAKLDGLKPPFDVSRKALHAGWAATPKDVRRAIRLAVRHIQRVAERQLPR